MFNTDKQKPGKGEATRQHVLETALKLFRRRGFERTTMRDIAERAGLSLGAAYHYFRSKDELVVAYYEWMQAEHERLAQAACPANAPTGDSSGAGPRARRLAAGARNAGAA